MIFHSFTQLISLSLNVQDISRDSTVICLEGSCVFSVGSHSLFVLTVSIHSCLWIEFHLAFQLYSSVCECILQASVLQ